MLIRFLLLALPALLFAQTAPFQTVVKTADYSVTATDFNNFTTILVPSGSPVLTMPASGSQPVTGKYVLVIATGGATVTLRPNGQNINASASDMLIYGSSSSNSPASSMVVSDGTNFSATLTQQPTFDTVTTHALFATATLPQFRAILAGDIPTLNQSTSGNAATATALATNPTITATNGGLSFAWANGTTSTVTMCPGIQTRLPSQQLPRAFYRPSLVRATPSGFQTALLCVPNSTLR